MNNPNNNYENIELRTNTVMDTEAKMLTTKMNNIEENINNNKEDYITKLKNLELSPDIRQTIIQEAFRMFDTDNSGEIDKKEFRKLVKSLGLELNNRKINELMKKIDTNNSGQIDMEEFTKMMLQYQFNKDSSIELHLDNAFNLYDKDQDGLISSDDLMKVSQELEDVLGKEEALLIVQLGKVLWKNANNEQQSNNTGIDKYEFYNMLEQLGFLQESAQILDVKENSRSQDSKKDRDDSI